MNPRLRPGLAVVRRDDRHLQVGAEPPRRVVLPDLPEVRRLLDALRHGRPLGRLSAGAGSALARLEGAGLLATPPPARLPVVTLVGPRALTDLAAGPLRSAGFRLGEAGGGTVPDAGSDVRLLLAHGALQRELADPLVRDGVAHLAAVATAWGWELGPFVVPGETACLRCMDAAYRDSDPRHCLIVDQLVRAGTREPPPTHAASSSIAMGWVARDLLAFAQGRRPTTWSSTVRVPDAPGDAPGQEHGLEHCQELVSERRWLRHPHCGCAWDALSG